MGRNCESMGFVPQSLQKVQSRVRGWQGKGHFVYAMKLLSARVSVRTLGYGNERHVINAQIFESLLCRRELALAAIDHASTRSAVTVERAWLAELGSGCSAPVGAHVMDGTLMAFLAGSAGVQRCEKAIAAAQMK